MKRPLTAATVIALALLLAWAWPRPAAEETPEGSPVLESRAVIDRRAPALAPVPARGEADTDTDAREPSPYLAAHAALAEALGYVAIRCWVGTEFDSDDLVGRYRQKIANGWYTNVVPQLEGRMGVERRYVRPDVPEDASDFEKNAFETLFVVSWKADAPGDVVPCEVHPQRYGTLRVRVVDQDGLPLPRARVHCCGSRAESDADGIALLEQVHAGQPFALRGSRHELDRERLSDWCEGAMAIEPFEPDETRELELELHCLGTEERLAGQTMPDDDVVLPEEPVRRLPELSTKEELARFRALQGDRTLGDEGRQLVDDLIRHRERSSRSRERSNELLRQLAEATDPDEVLRLTEELHEHLGIP